MIAVIQCAATKRAHAGYLTTQDGKRVLFVADPDKAAPIDGFHYARPDDLSDTGESWRAMLVRYNQTRNDNLLGLHQAYELYENQIYRRLAHQLGSDKTYILSAGWGLINACFLTPNYDITFSPNAEPYKRRKKSDFYRDLCLLPENTEERIVFFGGKDYIPLFCALTQSTAGSRTIFFNSKHRPEAPGCLLEAFPTTTRTNWHYECAQAFLSGKLAMLPWE